MTCEPSPPTEVAGLVERLRTLNDYPDRIIEKLSFEAANALTRLTAERDAAEANLEKSASHHVRKAKADAGKMHTRAQTAEASLARCREALEREITFEDVRLAAGEGKISDPAIVHVVNIILRRRASETLPTPSDSAP